MNQNQYEEEEEEGEYEQEDPAEIARRQKEEQMKIQ